jgi:hypothetical protein
MARTYTLRRTPNGRAVNGKSYYTYAFTVPPDIAEVVPEDMAFTVSMDDAGIHFIPVGAEAPKLPPPSWAHKTD